ncbi:MAG TPA: rhodanese-like domain-containing protein [Bacteroidales bacterium]|nr:rhodanese-like domain-containing protein [Bacteroidales bacterium]
MNPRVRISVILLPLGIILAFLPLSGRYSLHAKPEALLESVLADSSFFTVDQVARFVVTEDSTVQLIDLRSPEEFRSFAIPGAINIPYNSMLSQDLESYLNRRDIRNVFYANGDYIAGYAIVIARGLGFGECYTMKGGLNEWYGVVMNSRFTGEKITARENALFETRARAKKLFTEMNSMPDSLKVRYMALQQIERKKLDGGCE